MRPPKPRSPRVFVERKEALGDAILVTPFLRHLKPMHVIHFASTYSKYFPELWDFSGVSYRQRAYDTIVNLNGYYEKHPEMHILRAYEKAFLEQGLSVPDLTKTGPFLSSKNFSGEEWLDGQDYAVFHIGRSWRAKHVKLSIFNDLASMLIKYSGLKIMTIGTGVDFGLKTAKYDMRQKLDIHQTRRAIERAKVFIGIDSGPLHVAATTQTPQVGLYTVVKGELIAPLHKPQSLIVNADTDCINCLKRLPPPVTKHWCTSERPFNCIEAFSAEKIFQQMVQNGFVLSR